MATQLQGDPLVDAVRPEGGKLLVQTAVDVDDAVDLDHRGQAQKPGAVVTRQIEAMSLQIGSIRLDSPVVLAPMSGVTDMPFRRLVKEFGVGLVVSEMIASKAMIHAAMNLDAMPDSGDLDGERVWLRILKAVEEMLSTRPVAGAAVH